MLTNQLTTQNLNYLIMIEIPFSRKFLKDFHLIKRESLDFSRKHILTGICVLLE